MIDLEYYFQKILNNFSSLENLMLQRENHLNNLKNFIRQAFDVMFMVLFRLEFLKKIKIFE